MLGKALNRRSRIVRYEVVQSHFGGAVHSVFKTLFHGERQNRLCFSLKNVEFLQLYAGCRSRVRRRNYSGPWVYSRLVHAIWNHVRVTAQLERQQHRLQESHKPLDSVVAFMRGLRRGLALHEMSPLLTISSASATHSAKRLDTLSRGSSSLCSSAEFTSISALHDNSEDCCMMAPSPRTIMPWTDWTDHFERRLTGSPSRTRDGRRLFIWYRKSVESLLIFMSGRYRVSTSFPTGTLETGQKRTAPYAIR